MENMPPSGKSKFFPGLFYRTLATYVLSSPLPPQWGLQRRGYGGEVLDLGYMKKPPVEGRLKWKQTIRTAVQEKTTEPMSGAKIRNIIGIAKHFCKKSFCPYIIYIIPM